MLKQEPETEYVDIETVKAEISEARKLFSKNAWPVIDVTRKAVEETAAIIIRILGERGLSTDTRESGQL